MKKRMLALILALLLTVFAAGCSQETQRGEITLPETERPAAEEMEAEEPETPNYLNLTVQALYEGLLDADCPQAQAEQIAAWLDEHPGYAEQRGRITELFLYAFV